MLSGRLPYEGGDTQKMWGHANKPPPVLSETHPGLGKAFDPLFVRALAKDPHERYPSAGDLGRAAIAAARGEAVTSPERSVATGAAATGLATGDAPTRADAGRRPAAPRPLGTA